MNDDLRNSLKLWVEVLAVVGWMSIFGVVLNGFLSEARWNAAVDNMPVWVWLLTGVWGLWSIGRIG